MSRFMLVTQTLVGGGAERMVARLSTYLKKNGHEVIVVLSYRNDNEYTIDCNQIETIAEDLYTAVQKMVPEPGENKVWDRKYRR